MMCWKKISKIAFVGLASIGVVGTVQSIHQFSTKILIDVSRFTTLVSDVSAVEIVPRIATDFSYDQAISELHISLLEDVVEKNHIYNTKSSKLKVAKMIHETRQPSIKPVELKLTSSDLIGPPINGDQLIIKEFKEIKHSGYLISTIDVKNLEQIAKNFEYPKESEPLKIAEVSKDLQSQNSQNIAEEEVQEVVNIQSAVTDAYDPKAVDQFVPEEVSVLEKVAVQKAAQLEVKASTVSAQKSQSLEVDDREIMTTQDQDNETIKSAVDLKAADDVIAFAKSNTILPSSSAVATEKAIAQMSTQMASQESPGVPVRIAAVAIHTSAIDEAIGYSVKPNTQKQNFGKGLTPDGTGVVSITENIVKGSSLVATMEGSGFLNSRIDLKSNDDKTNETRIVPMVTEEFIGEEFIGASLGHLLVELTDDLDFVELERESQVVVYLDEDFKQVTESDDYSYILFKGITPGNLLIAANTIKGQTGDKTVFISAGEVTYVRFSLVDGEMERVEFVERALLGGKLADASLSEDNLAFLNQDLKFLRIGPSSFEYKLPLHDENDRKYIEVKNQSIPLMFGYDENRKLELPAKDLMDFVLMNFGVKSLEKSCIVQINLPENKDQVLDVVVVGETPSGDAEVGIRYLDNEGNIVENIPPFVDKIFLIGEETGLINIEMAYQSGEKRYMKSYCLASTYLVEQF